MRVRDGRIGAAGIGGTLGERRSGGHGGIRASGLSRVAVLGRAGRKYAYKQSGGE
jgi:hypothetical protein